MQYPGRVIKIGEQDAAAVKAIAAALQQWGYSPSNSSLFDSAFASTVKLFQSHHADASGRPLKIDGQVGPLTWGALFNPPPASQATAPIGSAALGVAITQIGVKEEPPILEELGFALEPPFDLGGEVRRRNHLDGNFAA